MGMDLRGAAGEFRWSMGSWAKLLSLAKMYGWTPAGTLPPVFLDEKGNPDPKYSPQPWEWDGGYFSNGYQTVAPADAAALADALELALPDVPDHDCNPREGMRTRPDGEGEHYSEHATPREWFGGNKERIREFIRYCRAGAFVIA